MTPATPCCPATKRLRTRPRRCTPSTQAGGGCVPSAPLARTGPTGRPPLPSTWGRRTIRFWTVADVAAGGRRAVGAACSVHAHGDAGTGISPIARTRRARCPSARGRPALWRCGCPAELSEFVLDGVACQAGEDLGGLAERDRVREFPQPGADELRSLVAGLHLEPTRAVVLQRFALAVVAPVARLAQRREEPQVQPAAGGGKLVQYFLAGRWTSSHVSCSQNTDSRGLIRALVAGLGLSWDLTVRVTSRCTQESAAAMAWACRRTSRRQFRLVHRRRRRDERPGVRRTPVHAEAHIADTVGLENGAESVQRHMRQQRAGLASGQGDLCHFPFPSTLGSRRLGVLPRGRRIPRCRSAGVLPRSVRPSRRYRTTRRPVGAIRPGRSRPASPAALCGNPDRPWPWLVPISRRASSVSMPVAACTAAQLSTTERCSCRQPTRHAGFACCFCT